jgi:hypothetical protein
MSWRVWLIVIAQALSYGATSFTLGAAGFWVTEITDTIGGAAVALWSANLFFLAHAIVAEIDYLYNCHQLLGSRKHSRSSMP